VYQFLHTCLRKTAITPPKNQYVWTAYLSKPKESRSQHDSFVFWTAQKYSFSSYSTFWVCEFVVTPCIIISHVLPKQVVQTLAQSYCAPLISKGLLNTFGYRHAKYSVISYTNTVNYSQPCFKQSTTGRSFTYTDRNHEKILRKRQKMFSKWEYFVKMGELFSHFDKNILILRKLGTIFFSHDFLTIFVSVSLRSMKCN